MLNEAHSSTLKPDVTARFPYFQVKIVAAHNYPTLMAVRATTIICRYAPVDSSRDKPLNGALVFGSLLKNITKPHNPFLPPTIFFGTLDTFVEKCPCP